MYAFLVLIFSVVIWGLLSFVLFLDTSGWKQFKRPFYYITGIMAIPFFWACASIELSSNELKQNVVTIHFINNTAVFKAEFPFEDMPVYKKGWINANKFFATNFDPEQTNLVIIKRYVHTNSLGLRIGDRVHVQHMEL